MFRAVNEVLRRAVMENHDVLSHGPYVYGVLCSTNVKSTSSWLREDGVDFGRSMDIGRASSGSVKAPLDFASTRARCIKCALSFGKKS